MSEVGVLLSVMSIIFTIGAYILYKNTPKVNHH